MNTVRTVLTALLIGASAFAQTPPAVQSDNVLSMSEALRIDLLNDPDIFLSEQDVLDARGRFLEQRGTFDRAFTVSGKIDHDKHALTFGQYRQQQNTRLTLRTVAQNIQDVADDFQRQLDEVGTGRIVVPCERLGTGDNVTQQGNSIVIVNRITGERTTVQCTSRGGELAINLNDERIDLIDYLLGGLDPNDPANRQAIEELERQRVAEADLFREILAKEIEVFNYVARELREALRRIGIAPRYEETFTTEWDLGFRMPYRNGIVITPRILIQTDESNFVGKTRRPGFGGNADPGTYFAAVGATLTLPLGKGRGFDATGGPERASGINYRAAINTFKHETATNALRTAIAYWNLVAAQELLRLREASLTRQTRLGGMVQELLRADEIARTDAIQSEARVADVRTSVFFARQSLLDARLALAREIGLVIEDEDDAPLASETFPEVVPVARIAAQDEAPLIEVASQNRLDLASALQREEAANVLLRAARLNLKRRFDLEFTVAYLGNEESQNYLTGVGRSLLGNFEGPSASIGLSFDLPFANNVAIGQLTQSRAIARQNEINRVNTNRVMNTRVVEVLGSLREAAEEVERLRGTINFFAQTVENESTRFRAGEATTIDLIFTEEQLTNAEEALVLSRQRYARLLAELRFELGLLVDFPENGFPVVNAGALRELPF